MLGACPRGVLCFSLLGVGCTDRLDLGTDLLWSADHESGDLEQWTDDGGIRLPSESSVIASTSARAHRGKGALVLTNPADWDNQDEGPELFHAIGALGDAYYSAWFLLPQRYRIEPHLTLIRLRSRDSAEGELYNGEELQLRSLADGRFVLQVFSNNSGFLLEPLADPAPHVEAERWFQLEARYESQSSGRLRVWLDGTLAYDLPGRPGAAGSQLVFSVCNVAEQATPAPLTLFVDDAAISLSRVTPEGYW
jgi:hypothetical protein